jgi:CDP-6-deoxy-D-xylo-4-hexulose-3-dehydrase
MGHIAYSPFLTDGPEVAMFEKNVGRMHGRYGVMVNSGSSANFIATQALFKAGDKVAIPASCFPTTLSPLIILGIIPVFVDCCPDTLNANPHQLVELSAREDIAGAVIPNTLGNPNHPAVWKYFRKTIEDNCDGFGSALDGKLTGTNGTISTKSFYPAHHIFTGQGGMALTENHDLNLKLRSLSSWGRDCVCPPGVDNVCGRRFEHEVDGVFYDHKYIAGRAGGNLRPLELCGVLGNVQFRKWEKYHAIRERNFRRMHENLSPCNEKISTPKVERGARPSWFSFPVTLKQGSRRDICRAIESRGCQTRLLFAGNITRHPMMQGIPCETPFPLTHSDNVMKHSFMVGVNQTITEEECEKIAKVVREEVTR